MAELFELLGCVRIEPGLNANEFEYLAAFCESRRWRRPAGPYAVPDHPLAELAGSGLALDSFLSPAPGQPGLWCPWRPGHGGRSLVPAVPDRGRPPSALAGRVADAVAAWLEYLGAHFLRRDARARGVAGFDGFGFDHRLDGAAAVADRAGNVTFIRVEAGRVRCEDACDGPDAVRSGSASGPGRRAGATGPPAAATGSVMAE